jgi:hypothetical protein
MKFNLRFLLVIMAIFLMASAAQAAEFSAEIVFTSKAAGVMKQKLFVGNEKSRMETSGAVTISRLDKKVVWMLMPSEKMYMEHSLDTANIPATSEKFPGEIERTLMGKEPIDGRMTEKYRIVYTAAGTKTTIYLWLDPALDVPIKTEAEDGSWKMEYKNIKTGAQPASLFEIPAGYTKMEMPSMKDMMKGMPSMDDMPVDIEY